MPDTTRLFTSAELERVPEDDYRYELVEGRLVRMSPVGFEHSRVVVRLIMLLAPHVQRHELGIVATELGFKLHSNPDTVRAPDVAFIAAARLPAKPPRGFWSGPPDLAIEVLSPDDRVEDIRAKVNEYLTTGVSVVVVIDPDESTAMVHRPAGPTVTLREDDILDLDDVIAGFRCRLADVVR